MAKKERNWVAQALKAAQDSVDAGAQVHARSIMKEERDARAQGNRADQRRLYGLETSGVGYVPPDMGSQRTTGDPDLDWVIGKETGGTWDTTAKNPNSTAFGLGQLLEGNRKRFGSQLGYDPDTTDFNEQLGMFKAYVTERYGTPAKARKFWEQHGWY